MPINTGLAVAFVAASLLAAPAFAADSMMSSHNSMMSGHADTMMMMSPGESLMVLPNGDTMKVPAMHGGMEKGLMKAATPLAHCLILSRGTDGRMYMAEDLKLADGKMACAEFSAMAH